MIRPLRVLLISPVRDVDPNSGDVTYTEQLLRNPPPGVSYTTYVDALANGTLTECGSRAAVKAALTTPTAPAELAKNGSIALWRKFEATVRQSRVTFREPLRHFRVAADAYDLVHVHVFHTRFLGDHPPVVMSAAGPLEWVYADAWGWSPRRVAIATAFDRAAGAVWGATMCATRFGRADRFVAFSDYLRQWLIARGWPPQRIDCVPNYLADPSPRWTPVDRAPSTLGFVAKDFDAKGGDLVIEAHRVLRADFPDLRLLIAGSEPRLSPEDCERAGITWLPFVPRDALIADVLPGIDLFVYPSRFDGLPYGPMEALALGIPLAVSDYRALPEMAECGAGVVVPSRDPGAWAQAIRDLLDADRHRAASHAAREHFVDHYGAAAQAVRLRGAYDAAVSENGSAP